MRIFNFILLCYFSHSVCLDLGENILPFHWLIISYSYRLTHERMHQFIHWHHTQIQIIERNAIKSKIPTLYCFEADQPYCFSVSTKDFLVRLHNPHFYLQTDHQDDKKLIISSIINFSNDKLSILPTPSLVIFSTV